MRYIRTVIVTVGTSQISKERKHFIRKAVKELLSFQFIPQGYFKKWNKSLPSSPRLSEVCWGPHAREVLPLRTPLLQHLPKPATWDSRVHLKFLPWPREFFWKTIFWQTGVGEGFGMFQVQSIYCALFFYFFPPVGSVGKESACSVGDPGSISGWGRSPGEGNDSLFQYSCLKNSVDWGALWATKGWTWLSDQTLISSMISSAPPQIIRH